MLSDIYLLLEGGANASTIILVGVLLSHHFKHRDHESKIKTLWDKVFK